METATTAAARRRSDKTAPRGARRRLREPTHAPELLPAPVDKYGRKLSDDRVKRLLTTQLLKEGLTQGQIALVVAMVDYAPGGQVTIAAMRTIAKRAGMGRSTAFRRRIELVARGLLWFDPKKDPDSGAQITSWHAIGAAVFERAGIFFSSPPPSHFGTPPRPRSGHKRDPSSILDPLSGSGSIDPCTNGMEHRARTRARHPVFRSNEDPAIVDLVRTHAEEHDAHYRRDVEEAGKAYGPHLAGTIAHKHREPIAHYLRNLAARALDHARTRNRFDLSSDAIRLELTRKIVLFYFAQQRPYLLETRHPIGCLWGRGGADGTPCDLLVLGARAFEDWCAALEDGEPARLVVPPPEPYEPPTDDLDEAREACEELRARAVALPLDEPPHAPELDDLEPDPHADEPSPAPRARSCAPSSPRSPRARSTPPPRPASPLAWMRRTTRHGPPRPGDARLLPPLPKGRPTPRRPLDPRDAWAPSPTPRSRPATNAHSNAPTSRGSERSPDAKPSRKRARSAPSIRAEDAPTYRRVPTRAGPSLPPWRAS